MKRRGESASARGESHEGFSALTEMEMGSDRSFGIVFVVVLAAVGLWPLLRGDEPRVWVLIVTGVVVAVTAFRPVLLRPLNRLWYRFGMLLGAIVAPVALGIVFYLTVVPTGLLMRAAGRDPLRLKIDRAEASYWILRQPPGPEPETLKHQF